MKRIGCLIKFILTTVTVVFFNNSQAKVSPITEDDLKHLPCRLNHYHSIHRCIYKSEQPHTATIYYLDFAGLSLEEALLLKLNLPSILHGYVKARKKRELSLLQDLIDDSIPSDRNEVIVQLKNAAALMVHQAQQIPFLADLGHTIAQVHYERMRKHLPNCHVLDYCLQCQKSFTDSLKSSGKTEFSPDELEIIRKRNITFTVLKNKHLPFEPHPAVIREALNRLATGGFRPGDAPIFIGFVPSQYADAIAIQHSVFFDCDWSLYFIHGEESHPAQGTMINRMCGVTTEGFTAILENQLWGQMLDIAFYQDVVVQWSDNFNLIGEKFSFEGRSPGLLHLRLLNGQYSAALSSILEREKKSQTGEPLRLLAEAMNVDHLTQEKVLGMIRNIRHLENYIACTSLQQRQEIARHFPESVRNFGNMTFIHADEMVQAQRLKAKKYFMMNQRIEAFIKDASGQQCYQQTIETIDQIDQCDCFVVYPDRVGISQKQYRNAKYTIL